VKYTAADAFGVFDFIDGFRKDGESWRSAAERIGLISALERAGGKQNGAAILLGESKRVINDIARKHGLRPTDRREAS